MRIKNMGAVGAIVADTELDPGAISENIDPALARSIVAQSGGALAIAPESEHTPEELATADDKTLEPALPPPDPPVGDPLARKGKSAGPRKDDDDEKKRG